MISKQITFDSIVNGLRKQNARCVSKSGHCLFRNEEGLRCAVGQLIEENEYNPDFDDPKKDKGGFNFVRDKGHNESLLTSLMLCHDKEQVKDWERRFKEIAEHHNLIYGEPVGD